MNKFVVVSIALLTGSAAFAGNPIYVPNPVPVIQATAPASDWTGFYAGVQGSSLTGDLSQGTDEAEIDGTLYGGHVGYNYDLGRFVLGAEIDYSVGSGDGNSTSGSTVGPSVDLDYTMANLKVKVGYDLGSTLVYGTAGLSTFEYKVASQPSVDGDGYVVGLGAEYRFASDWTIGGEYLFHDLDGSGTNEEIDLQTLQARISYHF